MLRSDNSIVASVIKFFIHSDEYVKLCDYADTTPRDNIHTIKRQINLKFIAECNSLQNFLFEHSASRELNSYIHLVLFLLLSHF